MTFEELIQRSRKEGEATYQGTLLCLDPGHTTGFALFHGMKLYSCGQINTQPDEDRTSLEELTKLITSFAPHEVVFEEYRVYKWRAQQHANSEIHTVRVIGMIMTLCLQNGIEYHKQMASMAKEFANDDRLKEWGFYHPAMRHANDAIRHGAHFIAFGPKGHSSKPRRTHSVG